MYPNRYAITFGECAVSHVNGGKLGQIRASGYTIQELDTIATYLRQQGYTATNTQLHLLLPENLRVGNEASVLLIKHNPTKPLFGDPNLYYQEQERIHYDRKYFDKGSTRNKLARYNMVFGNVPVAHSDDYKQCTVTSFSALPYLNYFRTNLTLPFGNRAANLFAEGNLYHEAKSHIGYHGDAERKVVICLSLGASCHLNYYWRMPKSSENEGNMGYSLKIDHGDIYLMSEKASGYDWRMRSRIRLVHGVESIILQ